MGTLAVARDAATPQSLSVESAAADSGRILSILCGLAAAWIAAGSTGLLGHALRHTLTVSFLAGALILGVPARMWVQSWRRACALLATVVAGVVLASSPLPAVNVMASALVLATLAWQRAGETPFGIASAGVVVFGLYRFAITSIPSFWLFTDWLAGVFSWVPGFVTGQGLRAGATFAGLDCLVLMLALFALWALRQPRAASKQILRMGALILAAHLVYLIALSFAPKLLALLPSKPVELTFGQKAPWSWPHALRTLVPWNLPLLAGLLHLAVAALLFKKLHAAGLPSAGRSPFARVRLPPIFISGLAAILALLLPVLASLNTRALSLAGKKIVVHEEGFLNWLKPKHGEYGRLSVGMYGMLPQFVQSYGATCVVSPELSEADMQGANLVVLIFPNKPWAPGQLERLWNFVRAGGSLLVLGEHTVREKEGGNRFNDALQPTAMRVAFDSAMFEVGGWLESYEALSHPATAGLRDHRNEFGVVIGASVEARWPARPVLVGRYGFSDPGDPTNDESKGGSMMGNHKYDGGEKLGDQLLVAEQRLGRGRVMVFGDTSGFSNSILYGSHDFTSRLFAYLCSEARLSPVRTGATAVGLAMLLGLLCLRLQGGSMALVALAFTISLAWTTGRNHRLAEVLPDGRASTPNRLAYIDTTHQERSSGESWRDEGLGGLEMTLMRSGYLVLGLHEFNFDRLQRAGLLISTAPGRRFTSKEIRAVRDFVERGGVFICTVGWPEAHASRELLADLGFYVGGIGAATSGQPEPKPFGHFKAPYFNGGDYMAYVRFHAAWNVESPDPQARPIAYGPRDPKGPPDQPDPIVILMRRIGAGKAVVVADSDFATNKNLEREGGQPFEGLRENADFWRWFLDYVNDQQPWTPPKPIPAPAPSSDGGKATP